MPPNCTHVQLDVVSSFLIQQARGEVDEIDLSAARRRGGGNMVEIRQSFTKNCTDEGRMEREGGGQQPGCPVLWPAPPSSIYRRGEGGLAPPPNL